MKALLFVFGLLVVHSSVWAKPPYLNDLATAYPESQVLSTTKCNTCHNNGKPLNAFGQDYSRIVRRGGFERAEAFKQLGLLDSDQDGVSNLAELLKGTNPGKADVVVGKEEVSYYFGDVEYLSADGKTVYRKTTSLVKRTINQTSQTIVEVVTQPDDKDPSKTVEYETTMGRVGKTNEFAVSDKSKNFSGSLVFAGTDWKWHEWVYYIDLSTGGKISGKGQLDEKGITTHKQVLNPDGSVSVLVNENLAPISEEDYKAKK